MADRKTVNVGVFAQRRSDGLPIPPDMVGRRIYYNYDREFFIITDENNKYSSRFYPDRFLQFVDVGAIVFTNDTVAGNLVDECRRLTGADGSQDDTPDPSKRSNKRSGKRLSAKNKNLQSVDNDRYEEDEWDNDYADEYDDAPVHQHGTPDSEDVRPSASAKDPTQRLFAFCLTTFIIVVIFTIVILFGRSIIGSLIPLLPG